ncbi:MAG: cyclic nucleotide-binding domain-containing protein [Myxococcota bacterium]
MAPLDVFERDIAQHRIAITAELWSNLCASFTELTAQSGECIYGQHNVGNRWLFVTHGVVASQQNYEDGTFLISRFFEKGQFCANLTSTWTQDLASDDLVAISDVRGVQLPDTLFRHELISGGRFGEYLRLKAMETLCFDKEIIAIKTRSDTETRYRFLEQHYDTVLDNALKKDVAAFLGVTPQGLSRFLRNRGRAG